MCDQILKNIALDKLIDSPRFFGKSRLGFELAFNSGSAFSLFENSTIIITVISMLVVTFLIFYYPKCQSRAMFLAVNLVITGAFGNIIDRFVRSPYYGRGRVVDFIAILRWPTFNLADTFVSIGVLIAIISLFLESKRIPESSNDNEQNRGLN